MQSLHVDDVHARQLETQVSSGLSQTGYGRVNVYIKPAGRYHLMGDNAGDIIESVASVALGFLVYPLLELQKEMNGAWATVKVKIEV